MEKVLFQNQIELYTIAFYNRMIQSKKEREFYRISYYLYFLKKANKNIFEEDYVITQNGIFWPANEKLLFNLVTLQYEKERNIINYNNDLMNEENELLVDNIYNQYKSYSLTKIKELCQTLHLE